MAITLKKFAENMRIRAKKNPEIASKLAANVAYVIVTKAAVFTPVDTSQAMSNWVVSLDTPFKGEIPAHNKGQNGDTRWQSFDTVESLARYVLESKRAGQTIYITNNSDHILELNDGSSKQQAANFIQKAIYWGRRSLNESVMRKMWENYYKNGFYGSDKTIQFDAREDLGD